MDDLIFPQNIAKMNEVPFWCELSQIGFNNIDCIGCCRSMNCKIIKTQNHMGSIDPGADFLFQRKIEFHGAPYKKSQETNFNSHNIHLLSTRLKIIGNVVVQYTRNFVKIDLLWMQPIYK